MIFIMEHAVIFWIFIAIVMGVVEGATMALVSIWFCIGAIAAALCALITESVFVQCLIFVVVTALTLALTRPLSKKLLKKEFTPTNADRIINQEGIVTETINPIEGPGQINVGGQIWSAKGEGSDIIEKGSIVKVIKIKGVRHRTAEKGGK